MATCTASLQSGAPCPCPSKYATSEGPVCGRHARAWAPVSCPVCLQAVRSRASMHTLPKCGHGFHTKCVRAWLARGTLTCPVCRAPCIGELRGLRHALRRKLSMLVRTLPPPPGASFPVYLVGLLTSPPVQTALDIDDATVQHLLDVAFARETEATFFATPF